MPLCDSSFILQSGNNNFALINDPTINGCSTTTSPR